MQVVRWGPAWLSGLATLWELCSGGSMLAHSCLAGWLAEYMLVHVLHNEGLLQLLQGQPTQVPALLACLCACVPAIPRVGR